MVLCGISTCFQVLSPCLGQIAHALLTRPPLKFARFLPKLSSGKSPLDLHVLSTPPAFVLSQDQTLMFNPLSSIRSPRTARQSCPSELLKAFTLSESDCSFFVSLCIVFKIRSPPWSVFLSRSRGDFYIIPNLSPFVNTFFPLFEAVFYLLTFRISFSPHFQCERRFW